MFGEHLPSECDDCGEDVAAIADHAEGCETAARIAEREIERIEDLLGTAWELDKHEEQLEALREIAGDGGDA